ncbi:MAG: ATP synthase F1 subunit gamma [Ignavibacteriae bacterium]|nr:ATP synthase F1 subunit gamma [Ignavibacteriota bacterium]
MATLKEIKNRITAVKSTQKITKAMKMISATKLKKAQDRIIATRPYAYKMSELLTHLVSASENITNPLMADREVKNKLVVIVSSDRGMCGSFNSNLIKYSENYLDEIGKDTGIITVGKKANDFFTKRKYNIIKYYIHIFSNLDLSISNEIANYIVAGYLNNEFDFVEIIYNSFKSVVKQVVTKEQFLPLAKPKETDGADLIDYIYEPSSKSILEDLIPKHLKVQFWKTLLESNAAELGARMTAMELATKNANDLIKHLNLLYNKARQEAITKELLEIVSGAEALKEG